MNQINELPSNPMSMLRLMPSRDVEVARFSKGIIEAVKQGHANPLEVLVMLRSLEAVSELVREEIEENIVTETNKYSEKTIEAYGARIEKSEVGTKYKYETSGDVEWEQVNSEFESIERKRKEREELMGYVKAYRGLASLNDEEDIVIRELISKASELDKNIKDA